MDAQADLSLRWAHSHVVGFVMRRLISVLKQVHYRNKCIKICSSSHNKGPKMEAMKHREELGKLLVDQDKSSMASGDSGVYESDQEEEDAIELLGNLYHKSFCGLLDFVLGRKC